MFRNLCFAFCIDYLLLVYFLFCCYIFLLLPCCWQLCYASLCFVYLSECPVFDFVDKQLSLQSTLQQSCTLLFKMAYLAPSPHFDWLQNHYSNLKECFMAFLCELLSLCQLPCYCNLVISCFYCPSCIWNAVPLSVKDAPSNTYRLHLKSFYFHSVISYHPLISNNPFHWS